MSVLQYMVVGTLAFSASRGKVIWRALGIMHLRLGSEMVTNNRQSMQTRENKNRHNGMVPTSFMKQLLLDRIIY